MGNFCKVIHSVNTHTGGQPTATIISGLPRIHGNTMSEKMLYVKDNLDWIRTFLTSEPRGSKLSSVAVLTEPTMPEADIGVFFFEAHGYMPMCGHDTIGVSTMLVETGMVEVQEPITTIRLETPNGLILVKVHVEHGKAKQVSFQNAPCFAFGLDMPVEFEGKTINVDVGYGGNFYALVRSEDFGIQVQPQNHAALIEKAGRLLTEVNRQHAIQHPEKAYMKGVTHISVIDPVSRDGSVLRSKNAVIYPPGDIDRSPCGTGTSARTAILYARGILHSGELFEHRSIIDSLFTARIIEEQTYFGYNAVIPEISGSAFLTGMHSWLLDPEDDKGYGFALGRQ